MKLLEANHRIAKICDTATPSQAPGPLKDPNDSSSGPPAARLTSPRPPLQPAKHHVWSHPCTGVPELWGCGQIRPIGSEAWELASVYVALDGPGSVTITLSKGKSACWTVLFFLPKYYCSWMHDMVLAGMQSECSSDTAAGAVCADCGVVKALPD